MFLINRKDVFLLINNNCPSKNKDKKEEKNKKDQNYLNEAMAEKQERRKCIC